MIPIFSKEHFRFPEGTPVPVHKNAWPKREDIEPDAYRIEEISGFDGVIYISAANIATLSLAEQIKSARMALVNGRAVINRGLPINLYYQRGQALINFREYPELPGLATLL